MPEDDELYARRLGFWLRMARERAGKSQQGAAQFLGFSPKSKSTISDYEAGHTVPSLQVLRRLAAWYEVPLEIFTRPEATPEERLDALARGSVAEAHRDLEVEVVEPPAAEEAPDARRDRRPA